MGFGVAGLLIASAAGYWVVTQAEHQKGGARKLGIYLGAAIIVVSLIGVACKIYAVVACPPMAGGMYCPMEKKGTWRHMSRMQKSSAPAEAELPAGRP